MEADGSGTERYLPTEYGLKDMRLLHLTVRRTPDFRNTNGMEQKTVT
jgi:hypothetical protein